MTVWRLARAEYPALDGEGARRNGGRWNAPDTPVIYTAGSLSSAALEVLVHLNPDRLPEDLTAYAIDVPDRFESQRVPTRDLPEQWERRVEMTALRQIGEAWAEAREALVLSVPSAVIPEERNYLLNPRHPDAAAAEVVRQRPFDFDSRLLA
jgi:RES domain-containing protein